MVEGITDAPTERSDIVNLVGYTRASGGHVARDQTIFEKIRKRNVGLTTKQQPRGKHVVVAHLQAAIEASERTARRRGIRIEQGIVGVSSPVRDMATDVEPGPIKALDICCGRWSRKSDTQRQTRKKNPGQVHRARANL